uniref:Broad substrate specificity ATP-binding cassette transporter ABCG2 n=2 Tax=Macrostomum lignano TaxID=282301 RepID=A0A1I8J2W0_9PLAT
MITRGRSPMKGYHAMSGAEMSPPGGPPDSGLISGGVGGMATNGVAEPSSSGIGGSRGSSHRRSGNANTGQQEVVAKFTERSPRRQSSPPDWGHVYYDKSQQQQRPRRSASPPSPRTIRAAAVSRVDQVASHFFKEQLMPVRQRQGVKDQPLLSASQGSLRDVKAMEAAAAAASTDASSNRNLQRPTTSQHPTNGGGGTGTAAVSYKKSDSGNDGFGAVVLELDAPPSHLRQEKQSDACYSRDISASNGDLSNPQPVVSKHSSRYRPMQYGGGANGGGNSFAAEVDTNSTGRHRTSSTRSGSVITFRNIRYEVMVKRFPWSKAEKKVVLNGISGIMHPGLNAIMGPTGSGKSSLLDVLAGRKDPQFLRGEVLVDGAEQPDNFKCMSGYVVQDDIVADSKIGTELIRGVSGGERKRTNIGMELITDPPVLFLDEPTTGLDAFTAGSVIRTLKMLANSGRTIIFSIHQPKYSIYRLFDNLTLVVAGCVVYHGNAGDNPLDYFARIGFHCEAHNSPPDFFMDMVHGEIVSRQDSRGDLEILADRDSILDTDVLKSQSEAISNRLIEAWRESGLSDRLEQQVDDIYQRSLNRECVSTDVKVKKVPRVEYPTSVCNQIIWVSWRTGLNLFRNPQSSIIQLVVYLFFGISLGTVFFSLDTSLESGIQNRQGLFFFLLLQMVFVNLGAVEVFIKERVIFIHESSSGFYRISVYFLAKIFCDMLPIKTLPVLLFMPIVYFMAKLKLTAGAFFFYELNLVLATCGACGVAFFISASVSVFGIANIFISIIYVFMMIFGGFLMNIGSMGDWLSWCKYLSLFNYAFSALSVNEFAGMEFCPTTDVANVTRTCKDGYMVLSDQKIAYSTGWDLWSNVLGMLLITFFFLGLCYVQLRRINKYNWQQLLACRRLSGASSAVPAVPSLTSGRDGGQNLRRRSSQPSQAALSCCPSSHWQVECHTDSSRFLTVVTRLIRASVFLSIVLAAQTRQRGVHKPRLADAAVAKNDALKGPATLHIGAESYRRRPVTMDTELLAERVNRALLVEPQRRNEDDMRMIMAWFKDLSRAEAQRGKMCVLGELEDNVLKELVKYSVLETQTRGKLLIRQGENGDFMYIILLGECEVRVSSSEGPACKEGDVIHGGAKEFGDALGVLVGVVGQGAVIGEVALLRKVVRTANVIVSSDSCTMIRISRSLYQRTLESSLEKLEQERESFASSFHLVSNFNPKLKQQFIRALMKQKYNNSDIIVRQGDKIEDVYFIVSGEVLLYVDTRRLAGQYELHLQAKNVYSVLPSSGAPKFDRKSAVGPRRRRPQTSSAGFGSGPRVIWSCVSRHGMLGDFEVLAQLPSRMATAVSQTEAVLFRMTLSEFRRLILREGRETAKMARLTAKTALQFRNDMRREKLGPKGLAGSEVNFVDYLIRAIDQSALPTS